MAVVDVYDALVSKRTYKERYSFDKANEIIVSLMGSQFDPRLNKYYQKARAKLESYYLSELLD
jgi:putative two-component system response regulator